jgi:hypothetical protein
MFLINTYLSRKLEIIQDEEAEGRRVTKVPIGKYSKV